MPRNAAWLSVMSAMLGKRRRLYLRGKPVGPHSARELSRALRQKLLDGAGALAKVIEEINSTQLPVFEGFHRGLRALSNFTHSSTNTKQMGDGFALIDWLRESESSFVTSDIYTAYAVL